MVPQFLYFDTPFDFYSTFKGQKVELDQNFDSM